MRRDDCATHGGLLVDLLGLDRWAVFAQAVTRRPVCAGRYVLTGDPKKDGALSRVLNRCWPTTGAASKLVHDDALELLADARGSLELLEDTRGALA